MVPVVCDRKNIRQRIMLMRLIIDQSDITWSILTLYMHIIREQYITERLNILLVLADTDYLTTYISAAHVNILESYAFYDDCVRDGTFTHL